MKQKKMSKEKWSPKKWPNSSNIKLNTKWKAEVVIHRPWQK